MKNFNDFGKSVAIYHGYGGGGGKIIPRFMKSVGFDKIHYPEINYDREWYLDKCKSMFNRELRNIKDIDLIIGFSLGGYTAFELAGQLSKNLILVNPAIDRSKILLDIKSFDISPIRNFSGVEVYLGSEDDLIDGQWTIDYLHKLNIDSDIYVVNGMEHNTSISEFRKIINNSKFCK